MIYFDSDLQNPITDAENIIMNYKISAHALKNIKDVDYYRKQMLTVLKERLINKKTLKDVGQILNVGQERIRQLEARVLRILDKKMKGLY